MEYGLQGKEPIAMQFMECIGMNYDGDSDGNSYHGIQINNGASYPIIGGEKDYQRNYIGYNGWSEVAMSENASFNSVINNWIGLTPDEEDAGNEFYGIHIANGATANVIENNVISNNKKEEVRIEGGSTQDNAL